LPQELSLSAFFVCFFLFVEKKDYGKWKTFAWNSDYLKKLEILENSMLKSKNLSSQFLLPFPMGFVQSHITGFYGSCWGNVSTEGRRLKGCGHGYDPHFYPQGTSQDSFACLSTRVKNSISHRGLALEQIQRFFVTQ